MNMTELSVKRPAAIIMVLVLVLGLGFIGYTNLGADLFPTVDTPYISVITTYVGAGADQISMDIIKPIEDATSNISGIESVHSTAKEGIGYTTIAFKMDTNMVTAYMDVQTAVESTLNKLPKDASRPILAKYNKNAEPIMVLAITGDKSYEELYNAADSIKKRLEGIEGVGNVTLRAAYKKELFVKIDKTALEYYSVSLDSVLGKLKSDNLNFPVGEITQQKGIQTVRIMGEFNSIEDIKNLSINTPNGQPIRLSDIAQVSLDYPEPSSLLRLSGVTSIGISIQKQSDANIVETSNNIKKELANLKNLEANGLRIVLADDQSAFINSSLSGVKMNLLEGIFTTSLVLFLFMRRWRPSIIVLVSIPTALIATFFMMYVFKFTLNIVSLLGLSVCIGILVDDSIVVLENIQRHLKMGKDPKTAAIEGRKEIAMAAIAITLCDIVVFAPLAFMTDIVGKFFREFGLTVVFATTFSLIVSFTLIPMLASRLLKSGDSHDDENVSTKKDGIFGKLGHKAMSIYVRFLNWSLRNRLKIISIIVLGIIFSALLIPLGYVTTEFLPPMDQSKIGMEIELNPGSTLEQTNEKVKEIENHIKALPEVKDYLTTIGTGNNKASAEISLSLYDKTARIKSEAQLTAELRTFAKTLSGVSVSVSQQSFIGRTSAESSKPVVINITGLNSEVLKQIADKVEQSVKEITGIVDVSNSIRSSQREISVRVDRLALSEYGISVASTANTLRTAIAGSNQGVFKKNGDDYDIVVKFDENQLLTPIDIGSVKITNSQGRLIALNQIADIGFTDTPQQILRLDRKEVVTITANIEGSTLGTVNTLISEKMEGISLPSGYKIKFGGEQDLLINSFSSLIIVLLASVVLVYMILVVLYESFLTPLIRMLSLPCGAIGAICALALTGKSLNVITMIGLIMLDGLASKNGTLLIDYANTLMKRGLPLKEALIESGTTRLKPIIMTTVTMIVGMLPAALAIGEGSEIKTGMAVALIGGMISSTILSPVLLPVVYTLMDDLKNKFKNKKNGISKGVSL